MEIEEALLLQKEKITLCTVGGDDHCDCPCYCAKLQSYNLLNVELVQITLLLIFK